MTHALKAKIAKKSKDRISLEITREGFEAFCDAVGLYRDKFIEALDTSERDHRAGRVTRRKSLDELIK